MVLQPSAARVVFAFVTHAKQSNTSLVSLASTSARALHMPHWEAIGALRSTHLMQPACKSRAQEEERGHEQQARAVQAQDSVAFNMPQCPRTWLAESAT